MPQTTTRRAPAGSKSASQPGGGRASWIKKFSKRFDPKPQYLIPILQFVQSEAGYLDRVAMEAVARFLRIPKSKVYSVASFYAQFYFTPRGRNKLTICRGTACHVRGSAALVREVQSTLGIGPGETTPDLDFTLETVACFGACALAPVVVLNEQVLRQQTSTSLNRVVTQLHGEGCHCQGSSVASRSASKSKKSGGSTTRAKSRSSR